MAATVIPDRFHNGYRISTAASVTPSILDTEAFQDVSNSDAGSKATARDRIFALAKQRHRYVARYFTDFENDIAIQVDRFVALSSGTGAASAQTANDIQGRMGLMRSTTGTAAAPNLAYVIAANNAILRLGGGRWFYETAITIPTLSTSGERYAILVGFIESTFSNLVVWCYDEGAIFGNGATYWQTVTVDAASPTRNSNHTQTTVAVDTWYRLGIEVNAAASEVKFYLNGTLQGTHTATIPSGTTEGMGFGTLIYKTVGNTPRTMDIDYILVCVDLTTAR